MNAKRRKCEDFSSSFYIEETGAELVSLRQKKSRANLRLPSPQRSEMDEKETSWHASVLSTEVRGERCLIEVYHKKRSNEYIEGSERKITSLPLLLCPETCSFSASASSAFLSVFLDCAV